MRYGKENFGQNIEARSQESELRQKQESLTGPQGYPKIPFIEEAALPPPETLALIKGVFMDISKVISDMKKEPDFSQNVGMILVHNGIVRGWSRQDHKTVTGIEVAVDEAKIAELKNEYSQKPGIYKIIIEYHSGKLQPGDDLLFILVAGDIREHVKPVLSELLDRVKSEAVTKKEIT